MRDARDQSAREPAETEPEVHRHALLRVRRMTASRRREACDQRRLAGPEAGTARTLDRDQHERLPRTVDEREEPEADALQDEPGAEHAARAEAVDERAGDDSRSELRRGRHGDDEPGDAEAEAAHVVQ